MTDDQTVTLREHLDNRIAANEKTADRSRSEIDRTISNEVTAIKELMREHAMAHAREHTMGQDAIDKAYQSIEQRIASERGATESKFASAQLAIDKSEMAMTVRFESVNEFRSQLRDQSATFVDRTFVDQVIKTIQEQAEKTEQQLRAELKETRTKVEELERNRSTVLGIMLAIGGVVTALTLALRFLPIGN